MTFYKTITNNDETSISMVFETIDDDTATVDSTHPYFEKIQKVLKKESKGKLTAEEAEKKIMSLVNPFHGLVQEINSLSPNLTYSDRKIFYKHEPLSGEMAKIMLDTVKASASEDAVTRNKHQAKVLALTNFIEKMYSGASETARNNLFRWIQDRDLVIYPDGDFLAYKGVVRLDDGTYVSGWSGTAFVNNVLFEKQRIPNAVGDVVSMPPSTVEDNEDQPCGVGLHAGTYSYAKGYHKGGFLRVKINPADVISVPKDSGGQKIRTSRYTVMDANDEEILNAGVTFDYGDFSDEEDDEDYDGWYDEDQYDYDDEDSEDESDSTSISDLAKNASVNGSYLEFEYKGSQRKVAVEDVIEGANGTRVSGTVVNEGNAYKSFRVALMDDVRIGERVLDEGTSEAPTEAGNGHDASFEAHPSQGAPETEENVEEQVEEEVNNFKSGIDDLSSRFKEGVEAQYGNFQNRYEKIHKNVDRGHKIAEILYPEQTKKVDAFISHKRGVVGSFKNVLGGKKARDTEGGDASEK